MILPQKISTKEDLSDTAKNLWLPAAIWGSKNGQLFGTNLQLFLDAMTVNLNLPEVKILEAARDLIVSGLFHELYMKHESLNVPAASVTKRKNDLLQTLRKSDRECHNN